MKTYIITLVIVATALQMCNARGHKRSSNQKAIMSAYQNVFSQHNTDRAMQMMQMAKRRHLIDEVPKNGMPKMLLPLQPFNQQLQKGPCQNAEPVLNCKSVSGSVGVANVPITKFEGPAHLALKTEGPCKTEVLTKEPINVPEYIRVPVPYPVAVKEPCARPAPFIPSFPAVSPFLPSASPVSAWAPPNSNLLPPVIPSQTRNHFLRKIPIPPPTL